MPLQRATYHHGDLANALLNAAWNLLQTGEIENLSLREVAKAAGVSPNAPYRHFADRQALLAAVAERGFRELVTEFRKALALEPVARLAALAEAYIDYAKSQPAAYRVMFGKHLHNFDRYPELEATASEAFSILMDTVAELIGRPPGDLAAVRGSMTLWAMVHGLAMLAEDCPVLMAAPERMPTGSVLASLFCAGKSALV